MLRQANNNVKIEGILAENNLEYKTFNKDGKSVEAIAGTLTILVEQNIKDQVLPIQVPVYVFTNKYTKTGKINPSYDSMKTAKEEFKSIAMTGSKDDADRVRITNGSISENAFYNKAGVLVSSPRIRASFIQRVVSDFHPEATFSLEFMLSKMAEVTDKEGVPVEPKVVELTVIVPQYGGRVEEIKLMANNPSVINAVQNYWTPGESYAASGRVNFTSEKQVVEEQVDFGEPREVIRTKSVHELVVTGGSQMAMEGDFAFNLDEVRTAMAERSSRIEASKTKVTQKVIPTQNSSYKGLDLGF